VVSAIVEFLGTIIMIASGLVLLGFVYVTGVKVEMLDKHVNEAKANMQQIQDTLDSIQSRQVFMGDRIDVLQDLIHELEAKK